MSRVMVGGVGLIGLLLAASGAAAQDIQCGDTLGPGGVFTLQTDLECQLRIGLTVRDGAVLDLGGHTVSVGSTTAIRLTGRGAVLQNGHTFSGGIADVEVAGEGGHTVQGIETGDDADTGFLVVSDHNRLEGNIGRSFGAGFWVQGQHNRLEHNTGVGQLGFQVDGDHNVLQQNLVPVSRIGFAVGGAHNQLRDNDVRGGGRLGDPRQWHLERHHAEHRDRPLRRPGRPPCRL
jgi:hypothetical protein